jgi:hypothetical protein
VLIFLSSFHRAPQARTLPWEKLEGKNQFESRSRAPSKQAGGGSAAAASSASPRHLLLRSVLYSATLVRKRKMCGGGGCGCVLVSIISNLVFATHLDRLLLFCSIDLFEHDSYQLCTNMDFTNPSTIGIIGAVFAALVFNHLANIRRGNPHLPQIRPDKRKGPRTEFRSRAKIQRGDHTKSQMADMLSSGDHLIPESRFGKIFRSIYRIPASMFEDLYSWMDRNRLTFDFQKSDHDCTGLAAIPLKLKALAGFFMLSTGLQSQPMGHQIGCDGETMRVFFLKFCKALASLEPQWIKFPETSAEVCNFYLPPPPPSPRVHARARAQSLTYAAASSSCGDIRRRRLARLHGQHRLHSYRMDALPHICALVVCRKGGRPDGVLSGLSLFVLFQIHQRFNFIYCKFIVDHSTKILAISQIYPGSCNDEHISRLDDELKRIRSGQLFTAFPFRLLSAPQQHEEHRGVYLIADGGYQAWRVLQMTFKFSICEHLSRLYVLRCNISRVF